MEVVMEKTRRFGLRLSDVERELVYRLARADGGLSQAAFIRRLIWMAATEYGVNLLDEKDARRKIRASRAPKE
jgi:hypothetical protein